MGYYEVVEVLWRDLTKAKAWGRNVEFGGAEYYPSGENWDGKCVSTLERAKELFNA